LRRPQKTSSAKIEQLIGKVIKVSDGDTITVLDDNNQKHKIRLKGIDAPESQQVYGDISTQSLNELVYDKEMLVTWDKKDKYYRILGKVILVKLQKGGEVISSIVKSFFILNNTHEI
jgi:endonuclease YncB( thermonuclease family)